MAYVVVELLAHARCCHRQQVVVVMPASSFDWLWIVTACRLGCLLSSVPATDAFPFASADQLL